MPRTVRSRVAPLLGVLLVFALLGGAVAWFADSRGITAGDLWEIVDPPPPEPCSEDDPTTSRVPPGPPVSGCLTPTALRLHDAVVTRFGEPGPGRPVRAITCWSEHSWNPDSDHPDGRACDFFPTGYGEFAQGAELTAGWAVASWLRDNAAELRVRYVIWQGRIWYRGTGDSAGGWGRPYRGGGVYDPEDATGGHFDHVHVSVRR